MKGLGLLKGRVRPKGLRLGLEFEGEVFLDERAGIAEGEGPCPEGGLDFGFEGGWG